MELSSQLHILATLSLGPIEYGAGWAPQLGWIVGEKKNILPLLGI
jgi:hypothetical protein